MSLAKLKERERQLLAAKRDLLRQALPVDYTPHEKQLAFHRAGEQARERLFLAGNRCGKTLCGAYETAMHLTGRYPSWWQGCRFKQPVHAWAASVTVEATRDILQRVYLGDMQTGGAGVIPPEAVGRITHRRGVSEAVDEVAVRHHSGGWSKLGFKSYDQGWEKFQGTARHIVHLDEEPGIEVYEECVLRTATVKGHILLTMTPLQGLTELCEQFLGDFAGSGKAVVRASWADAPHLAEEEKNRLQKTLRPHEVQARMEGTPSLGSGRIFPVEESQITVPRFEIPPHYRRAFGLDFGWTNPTAAIWGAYDNDTDTLFLTDVYQRSELAPAEHAAALQTRGRWIPGVCDPAGQAAGAADGRSLMEIYASHGVVLTRAENSVEAGLMQVLERLHDGRLKVFDDLLPWLEEYRLYRRDKKGRVVKKNDHLMDATRYLVMSGITLACTRPGKRSPLPRASDWRVL
jgi:phage terminase large subunit-like protein